MFKYFLSILFIPITVFSQVSYLKPHEFEISLRNDDSAVLLDLRDIESFEKGHIRKANMINFLRDDFREFFLDRYSKNTKLFIYAQSRENTIEVSKYIYELGYNSIIALDGGFEQWVNSSKPYKSLVKNFSPISILSEQNLKKALLEKKWTLVLFFDELTPDITEFESMVKSLELPNSYLLKIDHKTNRGITEERKITTFPTLLIFKNGIQQWKFVGIPTKESLMKQIY